MQPSVEKPKMQAPMEARPAAAPAMRGPITEAPRPEPRPVAENEASLRGGGMNVGFNCCHGHCSFHKTCC